MEIPVDSIIVNSLMKKYPQATNILYHEYHRQQTNIELIASENFPSDEVKLAAASCFMAKYAEGYPDRERTGNRGRYYGGCEYIDGIEQLCCDEWLKVFNATEDYHVNVQPASGSHANMAAYMSVLNPGDTILSMSINDGGHLTHSSEVSFVSKLYNVVSYGVDEDGYIDMHQVLSLALEHKPKLILAGASAYSRFIKYEEFKKIADMIGAYFMVDMAHPAGLIAAGLHPSPFGLADIITTTSQKTLGGPRGGMIFCTKELAKKVDAAVFPRTAGGPAENIIFAKLICAYEVQTDEYKTYAAKVIANAQAMADEFIELGYKVVTGGTDNHMFLLDFSEKYPDLTGKDVEQLLDKEGITLNKNRVPGDTRSPKLCSGVRIGLAAMTRKSNWTTSEAKFWATQIDHCIEEYIKNKH